ncbi:glycosyltransferase [Brevundimonas vesicularis]|uniref:glycosyltransferase family 4 protein n=1 Tax=Brevundimonas vesicularis TaxID=41276 RepID=UPI0022EC9424|nr:glycosyltransferase [Brevundimonas vesicularis]WBT06564.1 glycosyltransferase [Brevundimonas vesicularis]
MIINFVISKDHSSRIFCDIFQRFIDAPGIHVLISEKLVAGCDIYHYHRPQLERDLPSQSVVTVHHDLDDPDPFVSFNRFLPAYRAAHTIVCLNSLQKKWLSTNGLDNTVVIPHGYDADLLYKKSISPYSDGKKVTIGIASKRYDRRFKGEVYIYDLLDVLSPERVKFLLVGEGRSEDAFYMRSLGFDVECFEQVPYKVFNSFYHSIDVLLMSSTFEGGPANLPEAVATGTPVFATPVGMVPDMIVDGVNGLVLSGRVADDSRRIMDFINNNNGLYDRLCNGAAVANSAPTWGEVVQKHIELYMSIKEG